MRASLRHIGRTRIKDLNEASDVVSELTSALGHARDRDPALAYAHTLVSDLNFDLGLDIALYRSRVLTSALNNSGFIRTADVDLACALVRFLERTVRRQHGAAWGTPVAGRLAVAAAQLLPAADRARYAEEYQSELWDLAQAGAGRIRQLRHVLRQLASGILTRRALRSPRRRSAVL